MNISFTNIEGLFILFDCFLFFFALQMEFLKQFKINFGFFFFYKVSGEGEEKVKYFLQLDSQFINKTENLTIYNLHFLNSHCKTIMLCM